MQLLCLQLEVKHGLAWTASTETPATVASHSLGPANNYCLILSLDKINISEKNIFNSDPFHVSGGSKLWQRQKSLDFLAFWFSSCFFYPVFPTSLSCLWPHACEQSWDSLRDTNSSYLRGQKEELIDIFCVSVREEKSCQKRMNKQVNDAGSQQTLSQGRDRSCT